MIKHINLQLFAEGDTIPDEKKETNIDKNLETFSIRSAFGLEPKKEPEKKPEEKKPDEKPIEPAKEPIKEPEKDPKKEPVKEPVKEPDEDEEVVYLGKTVKVKDLPKEERKAYLQKGMNYDRIKEKADTANATLLRIAKLEGFKTVDEYLTELNTREKVKVAEQVEEAAGDPDKIDEIVRNHPEVVRTREERQKLEFDRKVDELRKDRFFKELEPQFNALMEANPKTQPELVYKIVRSDYLTPEKIAELITKEKESAEKKVIADVHDKERRAAPKGGDTDDGKEVVRPTSVMSEMARAFGVSANKVAQRIANTKKR
ncbi:MAG: hypothetical protein ABFD25_03250 [Clostridiaceae bacterium]